MDQNEIKLRIKGVIWTFTVMVTKMWGGSDLLDVYCTHSLLMMLSTHVHSTGFQNILVVDTVWFFIFVNEEATH